MLTPTIFLLVMAVIAPQTPAPTFPISAPQMVYLEQNHVYGFQLPITVKVGGKVSNLSNVQARLFPKRTKKGLMKLAEGAPPKACHALPTRVTSYTPEMDPDHPHIKLDKDSVHPEDLLCINGYLAETDYVMVVESADNEDPRWMRIETNPLRRYLRHAYSFKIRPTPGQSCGWRAAGLPAEPHQPPASPRKTPTAEEQAAMQQDLPKRTACIDQVN